MVDDLTMQLYSPGIGRPGIGVYKPQTFGPINAPIGSPRYAAPIPLESIPDDWMNVLLVRRGYSWAKSACAPEVLIQGGVDGVDWMVRELARLDARNLPRDRIFKDRDLLVTVVMHALPEFVIATLYDRWPGVTHGMILKKVEIVS